MEPGLSLQFISGLPREMLFSFYFTGDSPRRGPQLKRSPFPPCWDITLQVWGHSASDERSTGCILKERACGCPCRYFQRVELVHKGISFQNENCCALCKIIGHKGSLFDRFRVLRSRLMHRHIYCLPVDHIRKIACDLDLNLWTVNLWTWGTWAEKRFLSKILHHDTP